MHHFSWHLESSQQWLHLHQSCVVTFKKRSHGAGRRGEWPRLLLRIHTWRHRRHHHFNELAWFFFPLRMTGGKWRSSGPLLLCVAVICSFTVAITPLVFQHCRRIERTTRASAPRSFWRVLFVRARSKVKEGYKRTILIYKLNSKLIIPVLMLCPWLACLLRYGYPFLKR